jgi:hypothetical protein
MQCGVYVGGLELVIADIQIDDPTMGDRATARIRHWFAPDEDLVVTFRDHHEARRAVSALLAIRDIEAGGKRALYAPELEHLLSILDEIPPAGAEMDDRKDEINDEYLVRKAWTALMRRD